MGTGAHFVLVHGICFGSWCWYKVVAQLKSDGHKITAVDLAASGIHPKRSEEVLSLYDYSEPLMEFMAALQPDERIILVGHSMGGASISLAMEKFPQKIAVAVFLTAVMPGPDITMEISKDKRNQQLDSYMDCKFVYSEGENKSPITCLFGPKFLATKLSQLSPAEDMSLASLLMRPIATSIIRGSLKENALTNKNYGSVSRVYLIAEEDNFTNVDIQRWMIEKNPPDQVRVINHADHMAMLSRPYEVCAYLREISKNYIIEHD